MHADTVAPTAQGATIADGCLFGRGACDVKGPMAALIHGVADAHRAGTLGAQVGVAVTTLEEVLEGAALAAVLDQATGRDRDRRALGRTGRRSPSAGAPSSWSR